MEIKQYREQNKEKLIQEICEHCGKGEMLTLDLGVRVLKVCQVCQYKVSVKK